MVSSPPHEDRGGVIFQGLWSCLAFHMNNGDSFIWGESQLGISLEGLQYQFFVQLANAGPKSVEVNLTNCHREVCRIKFYQIVTSDVLTSLWQFDKLGHLFIRWVHYWIPKGNQVFAQMLNPHQYNDFIDLVKSYFVVQMFYNTVL